MRKFWSRTPQTTPPMPETAAASFEEAVFEDISEKTAQPQENERTVRQKLVHYVSINLARIPFASTALSAYYCAMDRETPNRVRILLFSALAYFVMPVDAIPDFLAVVGFTDDASVLITALMAVRTHILPRHQEAAQLMLEKLKQA